MPDVHLGSHTLKSHGVKVAKSHMYDWMILVVLGAIDITLNLIEPFHRFISEQMMNDVSYPFHPDTIPMWAVPVFISSSQSLYLCTLAWLYIHFLISCIRFLQ